MRRLVLVMMLAGCRQIFGIGSVDPAAAGDGAVDGIGDGITNDVAANCWTVAQVGTTVCLPAAPTGDVGLSGTLNTTSGMQCTFVQTSEGVAVCVIAGVNITVDALAVHGTRPLVLLATNSVTFKNVLDIASHIVGNDGPGANATACTPGTLPTGNGAGQGGTFGSRGGNGGQTAGSSSGTSSAIGTTNALRGGCPGIKGIGSNSGSGGGAVLVIASTIALQGAAINASGASGTGAAVGQHGGNGGGSGGLIALAGSGTITISGTSSLYANGGAGGGGSSGGSPGLSGSDPSGPLSGGVAGQGGAGGGDGGSGYPVVQNGVDGQGQEAGGGGGGGAGVIKLITPGLMSSGVVSPPAS